MSLFSSIPFAVFPLILSVGFWYSGFVFVGSGLTLAGIIQATYAIGDAAEVATWLLSHMPEYLKYEMEAMRVFDLLDNDMSIDRGEIEDSIEPIKSINLVNVTFSYSSSNDNQVVRDVSLTANHGEIVTIFGPYRSGKSTIFNLILRYYDPQFGKIGLNHINLKELKINYLRSLQAIVPQSPVIFDTLSLMDNVMYGVSDKQVSPLFVDEILGLCDLCCETPNWTSDRNLCQRISLARAFLRSPKILLLDEPFVHLSETLASKITAYIAKTNGDRITLLATSNPSELSRSSNQIFVMDWGRIVQTGNHSQLIEDVNGIYFKMN